MTDEALGGLITVGVVGALIAGAVYMFSGSGLEANVRGCLEQHSRKYGAHGLDHVYMTEVVEAKVWRSYPNGTATRVVTYYVQGSEELQSTTCLW